MSRNSFKERPPGFTEVFPRYGRPTRATFERERLTLTAVVSAYAVSPGLLFN